MSAEDHDVAREEQAIYAIALGGIIPIVIGVLISTGTFDGGNTLALIIGVLAIAGFVGTVRWLRRDRVPRADVVLRRR